MIIGIVGIGLIGGSFAKAYAAEGHKVLALDRDRKMLDFAGISGAVSGGLTQENVGECDLVLICLYPDATVQFLKEWGPFFGKKPIVMDCCGTKRGMVKAGREAAVEYGFTYFGGHPMAGTQYSGFKHAKKDLFKGAPMVLVPPEYDDMELLAHARTLLKPAGFGSVNVTTAEKHDEMIAFTSQLAHVVSNAYIKSPTAGLHKGFSAGSYKDMTRVAWLNPEMWAELFLDNGDNLVREIDLLVDELKKYRDAISRNDRETLTALLAEGKKRKEELDG